MLNTDISTEEIIDTYFRIRVFTKTAEMFKISIPTLKKILLNAGYNLEKEKTIKEIFFNKEIPVEPEIRENNNFIEQAKNFYKLCLNNEGKF